MIDILDITPGETYACKYKLGEDKEEKLLKDFEKRQNGYSGMIHGY